MAMTPPTGSVQQLPDMPAKPSFLEWVEGYLPFTLPRVPYPQTAKNLDAAAAKLVLGSGDALATLLDAGTSWVTRRSKLADAGNDA
jgi:hypothetical protein